MAATLLPSALTNLRAPPNSLTESMTRSRWRKSSGFGSETLCFQVVAQAVERRLDSLVAQTGETRLNPPSDLEGRHQPQKLSGAHYPGALEITDAEQVLIDADQKLCVVSDSLPQNREILRVPTGGRRYRDGFDASVCTSPFWRREVLRSGQELKAYFDKLCYFLAKSLKRQFN